MQFILYPMHPAKILKPMQRLSLTCALGLHFLNPTMEATTAKVSLAQDTAGQWQILRHGEPYTIKGAGGFQHLQLLRDLGGNTVRTWGIEQLETVVDGEKLLDKAHRLGLTVMVGIWVDHPRHGHDYDDAAYLATQRERIRESVRHYRDHPAILLWGLGNEMEGDGDDPRVWRELEILARIVKEEDPDRPVCTVIAGTYNDKVAKMMEHYTSLDLLGINIYAGAELVDRSLAEQGWDRPYLLTEFGPIGHWEVAATEWGAPLEPTSVEKAATYAAAHRVQMDEGRGLCLGTFCFIWGQKQETTSTWFGMFLPTGERTPTVDAMSRIWTGQEPANPAPLVHDLRSSMRQAVVQPGTEWKVVAEVSDSDDDELSHEWAVVAETDDRKFGGDHERTPPEIPDCVVEHHGEQAVIRAPKKPGAYRVFYFVRDNHGGGASGNFPFRVEAVRP